MIEDYKLFKEAIKRKIEFYIPLPLEEVLLRIVKNVLETKDILKMDKPSEEIILRGLAKVTTNPYQKWVESAGIHIKKNFPDVTYEEIRFSMIDVFEQAMEKALGERQFDWVVGKVLLQMLKDGVKELVN